MSRTPTVDSFRKELKQVIGRHNQLLSDKEKASSMAAVLVAHTSHVCDPRKVSLEVDAHDGEKFALVKFPDGGSIAMLGTHQKGDWLDDMQVDMTKFDHVEIGIE